MSEIVKLLDEMNLNLPELRTLKDLIEKMIFAKGRGNAGYHNLIPTLTHLTGKKYDGIEQIIRLAMAENNIPLLKEFVRFFSDIRGFKNDLGNAQSKLRVFGVR